MKQITAILLLCIYSISTLGISLKSFYCCGNLESVTVAAPQDEQKQCSNGDDKSDCCKTKYQFYKVKDSHVACDEISAPASSFTFVHSFTSSLQAFSYPSQEVDCANLSNAPPLLHSVPHYLYNCVFRI